MTTTTGNPVSPNYAPYYEDQDKERARLERCLQQQIEDCFTTISRIQKIADTGRDQVRWRTLREGLRCWRAAVRETGRKRA